MKISAIIITRNEEKNIAECIEYLRFADEIIVINNGSTDETSDLAKRSGAKVYQVFGLDFAYLRNVGREKAASPWLLYIDADERVTKELSLEIRKTVGKSEGYAAYTVHRKNYFLGKKWPNEEKIIRLIRKESLVGWQGSLHETAQVSGLVGDLINPILHYTHRDLASMVAKTNEWSDIEAQLRYQNNHPVMTWWRFIRVMWTAFWHSFVKEGGWRIGTAGLIESIYQAFSIFITYAKLWEKQEYS